MDRKLGGDLTVGKFIQPLPELSLNRPEHQHDPLAGKTRDKRRSG